MKEQLMRAAPAKRRNPGPPLTPAERTRLDALLEQTDDARALRALIRDALGIRDSMPSHREERTLLRRAVAHAAPHVTGGELAGHEVHALDTALGEMSSVPLRALARDAVELDRVASDPKTRALMRRAVASCDATALLENSNRSHAAYQR